MFCSFTPTHEISWFVHSLCDPQGNVALLLFYANKPTFSTITASCYIWMYNPASFFFFTSFLKLWRDLNNLTEASTRSGAGAEGDYKRPVALPKPGARSIL